MGPLRAPDLSTPNVLRPFFEPRLRRMGWMMPHFVIFYIKRINSALKDLIVQKTNKLSDQG